MKYNLERMLKEIEQDERRRKSDPKRKLSQEQIRELINKRKQERK